MAVKINFDKAHNIIQPTLVLATRSGHKLGSIPACSIVFKDGMNKCSELSFSVNKVDCSQTFWKQLVSFKLVWVRDWNKWFEMYVEIEESNDTVKNITAKSLGESELSQINLYDIEINTENDIARDDYEPTVLFKSTNPNASLLSRILEKAPHYQISHVDSSIANIQRTLTFDGKSIYDAFQDIAEEINCLFIVDCYSNSEGNIIREINVYDLESYCLSCGERGDFTTFCKKCGSNNIKRGYGEDTTILISNENLTDDIKYSTDNESVKNCFRLEAGDDLMTATLTNCNPNGSSYIWYISDDVKADMSYSLAAKIDEYNTTYELYQKEYQVSVPTNQVNSYNTLIDKYKQYYKGDAGKITSIIGYPALMEAYYDTIDFSLFLNDSLMPNVEMQKTTAQKQAQNLANNLSPVAVKSLNGLTLATADSAVLAMAKSIVDSRYQVKINTSSLSNKQWKGSFVITNYSSEDDTCISNTITCAINEDYETYVRQKIDKMLQKDIGNEDAIDIVQLFNLGDTDFKNELKKYSLSRLKSFYDCCQSCLDILIVQGISDKKTWAETGEGNKLYDNLYTPYYNKLGYIQAETGIRANEINIIKNLQTSLDSEKDMIQQALNFEKFIGKDLWLEFAAYRREDTYSNPNYISDGLNNSELFKNALEFHKVAKKEIFKSATLQHSISSTLKNLLVIKEFEPIVDYFEVGNWLRIKVDGEIYRLRLVEYEIDFDDLDNINIQFSDVTIVANGITDVESILSNAASMATSYDTISRQASKGNENKKRVDNWVENGLSTTNIKIVSGSDNQCQTWDSHGMLFTEYDSVTDSYAPEQIKIINSTIAITDDNWETTKTAIGKFKYNLDGTEKTAYGIIGETIVGKLLLGENLEIINGSNNFTVNGNGLTLTNGDNTFTVNPNDKDKFLKISKGSTDVFYVDDSGDLNIKNGILSITNGVNTFEVNPNNPSIFTISKDNANILSIDSDGNGVFQGKITATSGNIAGWTINSNRLVSANGLFTINSTGGFIDVSAPDSSHVKISDASINIYDNETELFMSMNKQSTRYYYNGKYVGRIGTSGWSDNDNFRGLLFGLDYNSGYMAWAAQDEADGELLVKLTYYNRNYENNKKGIHLACDTHLDSGNKLWLGSNVCIARYGTGAGFELNGQSADKIFFTSRNGSNIATLLTVGNVGIDCHKDLDMHNHNILNQSDARLKTNIKDTKILALNLLNKIELKEFDWIEDGTHEEIGIIAQQLQQIIPALVCENPESGRLSIKLISLVPYLIKAIQELYNLLPESIFKFKDKFNYLNDLIKWKDIFTFDEKNIFINTINETLKLEESKLEPIIIKDSTKGEN